MPHSRSSQSKRSRNQRRRGAHVSWALSNIMHIDSTIPRRSHIDGSGSAEVCQWDCFSIKPESRDVLARVASAISDATLSYLNERASFFDSFFSADRAGQSALSAEWVSPSDGKRSILEVADELASSIAGILGEYDSLEPSHYLVTSLTPSPLRALMVRRLLELSEPLSSKDSNIPEDSDICTMVHAGVPIGLHEPIRESSAWPIYTKGNTLKSGEPDYIRWPAKDLELLGFDEWPTGRIEPDMVPLLSALLDKELSQGRLQKVGPNDVEALTRVSVIWKPGREGTAIRQLDDFRRSGINQAIKSKLHHTIALPRFRDVFSLLAESPRSNQSALLEWDIQSAFRLIAVCPDDRPALTFLDPRDNETLLQHTCLPFGLVTSPTLFCRYSGANFRLYRRLLAIASLIMRCGSLGICKFVVQRLHALLYVDDVSAASDKPRFDLVFGLLLYCAVGIAIEFSKVHALRHDARVLGFRVDFQSGIATLSIPQDRLERIVETLRSASDMRCVRLDTLETLLGRLVWCSSWLVPLRPKLAPLYEMKGLMISKGLRSIRLSADRCLLFSRLADFLVDHHEGVVPRIAKVPQGTAMIPQSCEYLLITDACITGLGGVFFPRSKPTQAQWFSVTSVEDLKIWNLIKRCRLRDGDSSCQTEFSSGDICYLELFAMVLGVYCIHHISGIPPCYITWVGDNEPAVHVVGTFKSRSAPMRRLLYAIADWAPCLEAHHCPGSRNEVADWISRSLRSVVIASGVLPSDWTMIDQDDLFRFTSAIVSG